MVARIDAALFAEGVAPAPDNTPIANPNTRRLQFATYPVRFGVRRTLHGVKMRRPSRRKWRASARLAAGLS